MNHCPVPDVLLQVLEGKYSRPDQAEVETHLETCPDCQAALDNLTSFPLPGGPPRLAHPPSDEFLARLCQDHPWEVSTSNGTSPPVAPTETVFLPQLEKYLLLERLEYGGMGIVYRAWDKTLSRFVALKMIRAGKQAAPETRARFLEEARNIAQLQHSNIVTIHEVGEYEGEPFLAMEYLGGGSLAHLLRQGPLPIDRAVDMAGRLARAIQAAHDKKIVHRDLKPANVLLGEDGTPKVIDFGLAKKLGSGAHLTHPGALLGTPLYMAPEQVSGRPEEVGPAADIHALGTLLYEMLTGRPPFEGNDVSEVLAQVSRREPPPPPRNLRTRIPTKLQAIYRRCLAKEPQKRYPSATALAEDLERFGKRYRHRLQGRHVLAGALAATVLLFVLATAATLFLKGGKGPGPIASTPGGNPPSNPSVSLSLSLELGNGKRVASGEMMATGEKFAVVVRGNQSSYLALTQYTSDGQFEDLTIGNQPDEEGKYLQIEGGKEYVLPLVEPRRYQLTPPPGGELFMAITGATREEVKARLKNFKYKASTILTGPLGTPKAVLERWNSLRGKVIIVKTEEGAIEKIKTVRFLSGDLFGEDRLLVIWNLPRKEIEDIPLPGVKN